MKMDLGRIQKYLLDIQARHKEINELLDNNSDENILRQPWVLKGLKYSLIEVAEAMANTLQHVLAKDMGEPLTGYMEVILRAGETGLLPNPLSRKLQPFFAFRNSLVHRYWYISDEKLLSLVRGNKDDFIAFVEAIETYLQNRH